MIDPKSNDEISRLLKASLPQGARPDPGLRKGLKQIIRANSQAESSFPKVVLVALAACQLMAAVWVCTQYQTVFPSAGLALQGATSLVLANLAALPLACLILILRRKHA